MANGIPVIVAVGPVIVEDARVLLVKHGGDGLWKLPGGRLADGDPDLIVTMQREANEELGITASPVAPLDPYLLRTEQDARVLIPYFCVREGDIVPGRDIEEWGWFPVDRLPEDTAPNVAPALDSLLRLYGEES